jgi:transcriptional regulator with XRE-family HTH domain
MASAPDSPLGGYIRRQRELQKLSLRQLADLVGIFNPYLSQIERGGGRREELPWWRRFAPIPV